MKKTSHSKTTKTNNARKAPKKAAKISKTKTAAKTASKGSKKNAKKTVKKKAVTGKATGKKATVKKSATKKVTAKKTAVKKKTAAKKTAAKKTSIKKGRAASSAKSTTRKAVKTTTTKKTVKKAVRGKTAGRKKTEKVIDPARLKILNEINDIMDRLSDECLVYLAKQAQILHHNRQVEKINARIDDINTAAAKPQEVRDKDVNVEILDDDNGNFIFVLPGSRKIFNLDEMRCLVKIAHSGDDEETARTALYEWLADNRKDVLIDCHISEKNHIVLEKIYKLIISTYKLKKD